MADDAFYADLNRSDDKHKIELEEFRENCRVFGFHAKFVDDSADWFAKGRGNFTDVTIKCKDREWNAHRVILASRNEYFRACLGSSFKEGQTGIIEMHEENPDILEIFPQHIYTGRVDLFGQSSEKPSNWGCRDMIAHKDIDQHLIVGICRLADKYNHTRVLESVADFFATTPHFADEHIHFQISQRLDILRNLDELMSKSAYLMLVQEVLVKNILHFGRLSDNEVWTVDNRAKLRGFSNVMYRMLLSLDHKLNEGRGHSCTQCGCKICAWHDNEMCGRCRDRNNPKF